MNKKKIIIISIIGVLLIIGTTTTILLLNKNKNKEETTTTSSETTITSTSITTEETTTTLETTTTTVAVQTTKTTTIQNNTPVYVQPTTRVYKHERVETKPMKYHVNQVITYIDTIKVNSDESEEVISTKQKSSTIDYSTYSATTNDLKAEATTLVSSFNSEYHEMLGYVNQLRATEGASPLVLDYNLNVAATIRSLELGWSRQFSHTRPNGTQCFTVLDELGINYMAAGENIYYYGSIADVQRAYNAWDKSEGHHKNMVSTQFTKMGVGKAIVNGATYWTQMFGR